MRVARIGLTGKLPSEEMEKGNKVVSCVHIYRNKAPGRGD